MKVREKYLETLPTIKVLSRKNQFLAKIKAVCVTKSHGSSLPIVRLSLLHIYPKSYDYVMRRSVYR